MHVDGDEDRSKQADPKQPTHGAGGLRPNGDGEAVLASSAAKKARSDQADTAG
jgi:hypothetical protein